MALTRMRIGQFADVSGISRQNLIFYDRIGLLSPEEVDPKTRYRYYTYRQVDTASVILSLREIGMPLEAIRAYLRDRTPARMIALLQGQVEDVDRRIARLSDIRRMMQARIQMTQRALEIDIRRISLKAQPAETLFISERLRPLHTPQDEWAFLPEFYDHAAAHGLSLGLPVGTIIEEADLRRDVYDQPAYYFFRWPSPGKGPYFRKKPAGWYLTGYAHTDYGQTEGLYRRLFTHIRAHGLVISGNAYESFLLDEIATADARRFLMEITIEVERPKGVCYTEGQHDKEEAVDGTEDSAAGQPPFI